MFLRLVINISKRLSRRASTSTSVAPGVFSSSGAAIIPYSETVEEEHWAWYTPHSFYPVSIGDILHSKYRVLYKLGYGTTSTIWMCRDVHRNQYVCMKSMVCDYTSVQREIEAYSALAAVSKTSDAIGKQYVRHALDHFELSHRGRIYHFLIHEPLGIAVQHFLQASQNRFPDYYAKDLTYRMLHALEYLHDAKVIHSGTAVGASSPRSHASADLQARNILLRINDETLLKEAEDAEVQHPSRRKVTEQTTIFESRELSGPLRRWIGSKSQPVLCDFGEARVGSASYTQHIQPALYRAPEVFLRLPWSMPVDIWNLGCMVWTFMFGCHLFTRPRATDEKTADQHQLAQMVSLLGSPPAQLLADSGPRAMEFFNEDGSIRGELPDITFESRLASALERAGKTMTSEDSVCFLNFMRRALTWTDEARASAVELLNERWLADMK